ncbi:DUF4870 domain-containing protein [Psychrobacillus lasiicapitis]|uniref:DUF4870 domain-containing protein n=2 Tax=Psychrobacillus lasiicapitis TaxID=1636719 RepID=A0A544SYB7_9BACI|nr:DUF4870 domain-containing protein [Psychrobacillus lasiicapitis]TQR10204.1 DUF4870 domain-containing protein [Psychrobacillus lasiicapitis]GGA46276.1 membrane protein [Psychrobacillus lasiicapitis]
MVNNKMLSALSYFSVLFAPFIVPIIVFFVSQDKEVKYHAKKSLFSHIIPVILMIIIFISIFATTIPSSTSMVMMLEKPSFWATFGPLLFIILYIIIYLIVLIWNIIQGIRVLR